MIEFLIGLLLGGNIGFAVACLMSVQKKGDGDAEGNAKDVIQEAE